MAGNSDKRPRIIKHGGSGHTYVFAEEEKSTMSSRSWLYWQIGPSICASLMCIPFGIMLGWPSPTYVVLLAEDSPLPITMVESPMIAGFLMFGNTFATPFSSTRFLAARHSILISLIVMTIGWIVMWQATNLYGLLASRFIIGLGNGFGTGQVKKYITETCDGDVGPPLVKGVTLFMGFGVVLAYVIGPHVEFRLLSLIAIFITIVIFFGCFLMPHTAGECVSYNRVGEAKKMIRRTKPGVAVEDEINRLKEFHDEDVSFFGLFRVQGLGHDLVVMTLMAFVQQFCGAPATIVYCQFMFREMHVPHPEYCAIVYGFVFLFAAYVGIFVTSRFNKKVVLLSSCFSVVVALVVNVLVMYFEVNQNYWEYTTFVVMLVYISVHTVGMGMVPFTLAEYLFPENARTSAFHLYFMQFSVFAVIITKLFQVFYSAFPFYLIFCLFTGIGVFGCIFIALFIPSKSPIADRFT